MFLLRGEAEKTPREASSSNTSTSPAPSPTTRKARSARTRARGRASHERIVSYESNTFDLAPGVIFSIDNHPRADLDPGKQLLVIEALLEGTPDGEWTLSGEAAFVDVPYRPRNARRARSQRPAERGRRGAGGRGDPHRRVRPRARAVPLGSRGQVRRELACWIRVSQGWAGTGYGMIAIPRIGQEVLVGFLEGDPDHPSSWAASTTPRTACRTSCPRTRRGARGRANTSPANGGFNEIMFEDKAGKEQLFFVQAQRISRSS